jgi:small subunit ribosomal protein S9
MAAAKSIRGLGRRKSAVARVELSAGKGAGTINKKPLAEYFPTVALQDAATSPLKLTSQHDALKLSALVNGGGKQAQAEAVKLGAARALVEMNPAWRKQLKDAGMLTRDPRAKERKKPGLKRARRAPQFSKR